MPLGPTSFQRSPIEFQKDRTPVISQGNARCWQPSSRRSKMPWYAMINPLEPCKLRCFKHGCAKPLPLQHWLISWCYYFPCLTILHVFFLRTTPFPRISVVVSQNYTYHIPKKTPFLVLLLLFLVVFQVEVVLIGWIPPRELLLPRPRALLPERLEFEAWESRDLKQIVDGRNPRSAVVVGSLPSRELFGVIC